MRRVQIEVPLSQLVAGKRNPRKVKPSREAQRRFLASIGSLGLIQPLVVRPAENKPKQYVVVAGNRRLAALKEVHRNNGNPKIPCIVRDVDDVVADAVALAENFQREQMHPLDEAEAFANLATQEGKDAEAIASQFGVKAKYVRQRMKLASLAPELKSAYREGKIDTGMAEAFAAVPEDRQMEVWKELRGRPQHAEHVRNVIANAWIDAKHAIFEISTLPETAVSRDLFNDRVLIERSVFMEAQAQALAAEREELLEQGWKEVVIGKRDEVQDRLYAMVVPEQEFDEKTSRQLEKIAERRAKLEKAAERISDDDETRRNRLNQRFDALEAEEEAIIENAPEFFSEGTKSVTTVFLVLNADGEVDREYRIPRQRRTAHGDGNNGVDGGEADTKPQPPTSDDLSDRQLAATFTHQALAVREGLLEDSAARRRVLALILHDKVRSEALAIRHEANGTTLHAANGESFTSGAFDRMQEKRKKIDPFIDKHCMEDDEAYKTLRNVSNAKLDALIDILIVETIAAHMQRQTKLVIHLAKELKVNIREYWRPDASWLSSFQKIQLAHLITHLKGDAHAPDPSRKKSELVEVLAKLFADAAEGNLEDKKLAEKVNQWIPANLKWEPTD